MPSGSIPQSFMLFMVFGLLAAGIIALAGFAIDKSADKDVNAPLEAARAAALEEVEAGRGQADLDLAALVAETRGADETTAFLQEHRQALFGGEDVTETEITDQLIVFLVARGVYESPEAAVAAVATTDAEPPSVAEPEPPAGTEDGAVSANPARGQELFFANGCNICHGDTGGGGIGTTLASTTFTLEQVVQQYRTPRGTMPAFSVDRVPDSDVEHILAWLQTLPLPDTIVPGEGTP